MKTFSLMQSPRGKTKSLGRNQRGLSMIVVLLMLTVIFAISAITAQITLLAERSSRNDRDRQIAYQAAEAALSDAEIDILGPNTAANSRCSMRSGKTTEFFEDGCGSDSATKTRGLCSKNETAKPLYTTVNFDDSSATPKYATFGEFTGRSGGFSVGSAGAQSAALPRYIIEVVDHRGFVQSGSGSVELTKPNDDKSQGFLITAVGFGTTKTTQIMLQALVYKPKPSPGC